MVERFVKTMKEDYIAFTPKLSVSNLTMAIEHYNENHPHSAQGYLLPGEISTSAGHLFYTPLVIPSDVSIHMLYVLFRYNVWPFTPIIHFSFQSAEKAFVRSIIGRTSFRDIKQIRSAAPVWLVLMLISVTVYHQSFACI